MLALVQSTLADVKKRSDLRAIDAPGRAAGTGNRRNNIADRETAGKQSFQDNCVPKRSLRTRSGDPPAALRKNRRITRVRKDQLSPFLSVVSG